MRSTVKLPSYRSAKKSLLVLHNQKDEMIKNLKTKQKKYHLQKSVHMMMQDSSVGDHSAWKDHMKSSSQDELNSKLMAVE